MTHAPTLRPSTGFAGAAPASALLVIAALVIWTQAQPFASLQDYGSLSDPTQSNGWRRLSTIAITLACPGLAWMHGRLGGLAGAAGPWLAAVFVWFVLSALVSAAPGLALNRLALAGSVVLVAYALPLLFDRFEHFLVAYGVAISAAIALSFLGVLAVPERAVHTAMDVVEQGLAGDWRGIFRHKNDLGPMAAHFAFFGLLLMRAGRPAWGAWILASALVLLAMSGAKSAALLFLPALAGAALMVRARSAWVTVATALGLIGGLTLATVGTVLVPGLQGAIAAVLPDASFTGRSDVWSLALDAIARAPVAGYGYALFWDTNLTYSVAETDSTAALMSHAHNGYLETAIGAGLPGLALVLMWTLVLPLRHILAIKRGLRSQRERAFLEFLVAGWLFLMMISSFEAVLFNRGDAIWFAGLVSIACLACWSRAPLAR
jgi:O-antigen ligase